MPEVINLKNNSKLVFIRRDVPGTSIVGYNFIVGANQETSEENGLSHFLEHNMFKGTKTRSKDDISFSMEKNAAYMNAYTSHMETFYYADVPPEKTEETIEILHDMVFNSIFPSNEIEIERQVVAEEYKMSREKPNVIVYNNLREALFGSESSYGRTVLGPIENILGFDRDMLLKYYNKWYNTNNMVIYVVVDNSVNKDQIVNKINDLLDTVDEARKNNLMKEEPVFEFKNRLVYEPSKFDHVNIAIGLNLGYTKEFNYREKKLASLFSSCISGGFSSPFFRIVRDEKGLVYSSHFSFYEDVPFSEYVIYGSTSKEKLEEFIKTTHEIIMNPTKYITKEIFEIAKNMALANFYRMLENKSSLMSIIKSNYNINNDFENELLSYLSTYRSITFDEVISFVEKLENTKSNYVSIVGKIGNKKESVFELIKEKYGNMEVIEK